MSINGIFKQLCLSNMSNADRFLLRYAGNQNYSRLQGPSIWYFTVWPFRMQLS